MYNRTTKTLEYVRHMSGLKENLIFLGMLDSSRYFFKSYHSSLKIMKNTDVVMKSVKKNGLYALEGLFVTMLSTLHIEPNVDKAKLWHLRLGHINTKGMQELSKQGLMYVYGDKIKELDFCENYIFGKAHRVKFEKGLHKAKNVIGIYAF